MEEVHRARCGEGLRAPTLPLSSPSPQISKLSTNLEAL